MPIRLCIRSVLYPSDVCALDGCPVVKLPLMDLLWNSKLAASSAKFPFRHRLQGRLMVSPWPLFYFITVCLEEIAPVLRSRRSETCSALYFPPKRLICCSTCLFEGRYKSLYPPPFLSFIQGKITPKSMHFIGVTWRLSKHINSCDFWQISTRVPIAHEWNKILSHFDATFTRDPHP